MIKRSMPRWFLDVVYVYEIVVWDERDQAIILIGEESLQASSWFDQIDGMANQHLLEWPWKGIIKETKFL